MGMGRSFVRMDYVYYVDSLSMSEDGESLPVSERGQMVDEIKWVFAENTKVTRVEEGFEVESELDDGLVVSGGQRITILLSEKTKVEFQTDDGRATLPGVYEVRELKVNGGNIPLPNALLIWPQHPPPPPPGRSRGRRRNFVREFLDTDKEMVVDSTTRQILMTHMNDAGDLASLFHEMGHLDGEMVGSQDRKLFIKIMRGSKQETKLTDMEKGVVADVFLEERRASTNGLERIRDLRQKGVDLFPKDPHLVSVKLNYVLSLSTYLGSGLKINMGRLVKNPGQYLKIA